MYNNYSFAKKVNIFLTTGYGNAPRNFKTVIK